MSLALESRSQAKHKREELESAVVRFAGDSGDGMQLTGSQFTLSTAVAGNDLATFPDFPAEIRAPVGTTFGVSSYQINFGTREIRTSGDEPDVLVAMNPAALITNLDDLRDGGLLIVDTGSFNERNLKKAGYESDPLEGESLDKYRVLALDMSKMTLNVVKALEDIKVSNKEALRSKNMWALGLVLWLFDRDTAATRDWLSNKFAKLPDIAKANIACLEAGHAYGDTAEMPAELPQYHIPPAKLDPGEYRNVTGSEAFCWGLAAAAYQTNLPVLFCSYPITPASNMLHGLARMGPGYGISTYQAEDEIAAICAAIGASYAGNLGVTASSGPGVALKSEALGLAIAAELPLILFNAQRGGPSTGLPTKTEQSDLHQAVYGRNGDAPIPVLAVSSPGDCFYVMSEAARIATKYMTPVIVLSDGYITNASEPWKLPDVAAMERWPADNHTLPEDFAPYRRDEKTLARPWVVPGVPGGAHRIGGLERANVSGNVSYDPANHQLMTDLRERKIANIANDTPEQDITLGADSGKVAVLGWGSTFGPINRAVGNLTEAGHPVSHVHLRHIWPLPRNLDAVLDRFDTVLVPEMNNGQLVTVIRAELLKQVVSLPQISGKPFKVAEIEAAVMNLLKA